MEELTDELEESTFDVPPEFALTFSALRADGGYRLYRYYVAKCSRLQDHPQHPRRKQRGPDL